MCIYVPINIFIALQTTGLSVVFVFKKPVASTFLATGFVFYNLFVLMRKEFETTETEEAAMAKPAKTGLSSQPKRG